MACIDLIKKLDPERPYGVLPPGSSFAQVVSFSLRVFCESARTTKIVPTREGFEYAELMALFPDTPSSDALSRKIDISKNIELALGEQGRVETVGDIPRKRPEGTMAQRAARRRILELGDKRTYTPESWTPADDEEWKFQIAVEAGEVDPMDESQWPAALRTPGQP